MKSRPITLSEALDQKSTPGELRTLANTLERLSKSCEDWEIRRKKSLLENAEYFRRLSRKIATI